MIDIDGNAQGQIETLAETRLLEQGSQAKPARIMDQRPGALRADPGKHLPLRIAVDVYHEMVRSEEVLDREHFGRQIIERILTQPDGLWQSG